MANPHPYPQYNQPIASVSQPQQSPGHRTAMKNNEAMFEKLREELKDGRISVFTTAAHKVENWLKDARAYYPEARPVIAQDTIRRISGCPAGTTFHIALCPQNLQAWADSYLRLLNAALPFKDAFRLDRGLFTRILALEAGIVRMKGPLVQPQQQQPEIPPPAMPTHPFPPVAMQMPVQKKALTLPRTRPLPQAATSSVASAAIEAATIPAAQSSSPKAVQHETSPPVPAPSPVFRTASAAISEKSSTKSPVVFPTVEPSSISTKVLGGKKPISTSFLQKDLQYWNQKHHSQTKEQEKHQSEPIPAVEAAPITASVPAPPQVPTIEKAPVSPATIVPSEKSMPNAGALDALQSTPEPMVVASTPVPEAVLAPTVPTPPKPLSYNPLSEHLKSAKKPKRGPPGLRVLPIPVSTKPAPESSSSSSTPSIPPPIPTIDFNAPPVRKRRPPGIKITPEMLLATSEVQPPSASSSSGSADQVDEILNAEGDGSSAPTAEEPAEEVVEVPETLPKEPTVDDAQPPHGEDTIVVDGADNDQAMVIVQHTPPLSPKEQDPVPALHNSPKASESVVLPSVDVEMSEAAAAPEIPPEEHNRVGFVNSPHAETRDLVNPMSPVSKKRSRPVSPDGQEGIERRQQRRLSSPGVAPALNVSAREEFAQGSSRLPAQRYLSLPPITAIREDSPDSVMSMEEDTAGPERSSPLQPPSESDSAVDIPLTPVSATGSPIDPPEDGEILTPAVPELELPHVMEAGEIPPQSIMELPPPISSGSRPYIHSPSEHHPSYIHSQPRSATPPPIPRIALPDPNAPLFGPELTVLGHFRGKEEAMPHEIRVDFDISAQQLALLARWSDKFTREEDMSTALCVSIAVFKFGSLDKHLHSEPEELLRGMRPCEWPCKRVHQVQINGRGYLPLTPPYTITTDYLYDITHKIKEGNNIFEFYHYGATKDYVFAILLHKPTVNQLLPIQEHRDRQVEWKQFLKKMNKFPDIPPLTSLTLISPDSAAAPSSFGKMG